MTARIVYAGDTSPATAAAYLAGVMTHAGLEFAYVPSDAPLGPEIGGAEITLYIISDYPVKNLGERDFHRILSDVQAGAGLLMIGGWESFHGAAGEYAGSPLAEALPVEMARRDDRVNCPQPCLVEKLRDHPILAGLPFDRPPCIGGYNRLRPKPDATVILAARHVAVETKKAGGFAFTEGASAPLLVLGRFGRGRTAAYAGDVAPHWVGGFVDWGDERVSAQAPGADGVEVGSHYAEFFTRLVRWASGASL